MIVKLLMHRLASTLQDDYNPYQTCAGLVEDSSWERFTMIETRLARLRWCTVLLLIFLMAGFASGSEASDQADALARQHQLSRDFETPHTDWAQPYAGSRTSVLYFSSPRDTRARHIVELMQRFEVNCKAIYWDTRSKKLLGGQTGHERLARLMKRSYDCYIFNNIPRDALTAEEREKILGAVRQGAGLVNLGSMWPELDRSKVLSSAKAGFLSDMRGRAYRLAKGRVCRMSGPPDIEYDVGWQVKYDHWQERLGRAVLWTAQHEPTARLKISFAEKSIERSELPAEHCLLSWKKGPVGGALNYRIRRADGRVIRTVSEELSNSQGEMTCRIPVVRQDTYHFDAWIKEKGGIATWDTRDFEVRASNYVKSVSLETDWGEVGEQITGSVKLIQSPVDSQELRVELVDRHDRVLSRKSPDFSGNTADFGFQVKDWMPMLLRVRASLHGRQREVSCAHAYFRVTNRQRDRFHFLVWDFPGGALAPYAEQQLSELGASLQLSGGNPPRIAAAYEMSWVPYTTRILAEHDTQGYMKPTCWNNEPEIQKYVDGIAAKYRQSRQHGVFAYSLGDEVDTQGACVRPACMEAYRRYLKKQYGNIKKLNESWESSYGSFEDVKLLKPGDNDAKTALERGNYPRWYDRQAFKSYNQIQFCERFAAAFGDMDPDALTGFEGAGRMWNGDNYDLLVRKMDFWSPYPDPGDEVIRSLCPAGFITGNWMGYAKTAKPLLRKYWRMILRGKNVVQWWRWDSCGNRGGEFAWHGLLRPDLTPYQAVHELVRDTQIVRDGLGDILMRSDMEDDDIVILYSQPSACAARIKPGSTFGRYEDHHAAWHRIIREAGLQFRYVTGAMLERGDFDADNCEVLILPRAEAIGDHAVSLLRDFVRQGGTLIADVRPGIYDDHMKPRKSGALDGLFGVERADGPPASRISGKLEGRMKGSHYAIKLENVRYDAGLELRDGEAHGHVDGKPAVITHESGKGRAVLLNFTFSGYPHLAKSGQAAWLVESLFRSAGVQPQVTLTDRKGNPVRDIELVRWRNGNMRILAMSHVLQGAMGGISKLRVPSRKRNVVVNLPQSKNLYNLRENKHMGHARRFEVAVEPARPALLLTAKEPLPAPEIDMHTEHVSRGGIARASVSVPGANGAHAVKLRLRMPDGGQASWFSQSVLTNSKKRDVEFPIAFNARPGTWTVKAIDLYTGQTDEVDLGVE